MAIGVDGCGGGGGGGVSVANGGGTTNLLAIASSSIAMITPSSSRLFPLAFYSPNGDATTADIEMCITRPQILIADDSSANRYSIFCF